MSVQRRSVDTFDQKSLGLGRNIRGQTGFPRLIPEAQITRIPTEVSAQNGQKNKVYTLYAGFRN